MKTLEQIVTDWAKLEESDPLGEWIILDNEIQKTLDALECQVMDMETFNDARWNAMDMDQIDAFLAYVDYQGEEYAVDFEDQYLGEWDSIEAYAESYLEESGTLDEIPENLRQYFDMKAFAFDLEYDLFTIESDHGLYVFNNY